MENGPFIDDFPIKTSIYEGFSMAMLNYQRVKGPMLGYQSLTQSHSPLHVVALARWIRSYPARLHYFLRLFKFDVVGEVHMSCLSCYIDFFVVGFNPMSVGWFYPSHLVIEPPCNFLRPNPHFGWLTPHIWWFNPHLWSGCWICWFYSN